MSSSEAEDQLWSASELKRLQKLKRKREATEPYNTSEGRKRARELAIEQANERLAAQVREAGSKGKEKESGLNGKPIPRGLEVESDSSSEFRSDVGIGSAHALPPSRNVDVAGEGPRALTAGALMQQDERRRAARKEFVPRTLQRAAPAPVGEDAEMAQMVDASRREQEKAARRKEKTHAERKEQTVPVNGVKTDELNVVATAGEKKKGNRGRKRGRGSKPKEVGVKLSPLGKQLAKPDLTRPADMPHGAWNKENGYHVYRLGDSRDAFHQHDSVVEGEETVTPIERAQKQSRRAQRKVGKGPATAQRNQSRADVPRAAAPGVDETHVATKQARRERRQAKKQARKARRASAGREGETGVAIDTAA